VDLPCPEPPQQAKSAVGKLFLRLPRTLRPPMLILSAQMGRTACVARKLDFLELRDSNAQSLVNSAQSRLLRPFWRPCDLLEKVAAQRIVRTPDRPIGFTYQLRHDVQIADAREEGGQITERLVDIDLLEVGLCEPRGVGPILVGGRSSSTSLPRRMRSARTTGRR
jgi:hypothetical protein